MTRVTNQAQAFPKEYVRDPLALPAAREKEKADDSCGPQAAWNTVGQIGLQPHERARAARHRTFDFGWSVLMHARAVISNGMWRSHDLQ
jgi:hypothetical protein